jgi:hypothetical protein
MELLLMVPVSVTGSNWWSKGSAIGSGTLGVPVGPVDTELTRNDFLVQLMIVLVIALIQAAPPRPTNSVYSTTSVP